MNRLANFALAILSIVVLAKAQSLTDNQIAQVDFQQRLGEHIPLDALFRDETGSSVTLNKYFKQRPVVLAFAYYDCPNLCTTVLNALLESLRNLRSEVGRDFEVLIVSINPDDAPANATAKRDAFALHYGRPGSARGWHFLTGEASSIRRLTDSVGYYFQFDPASKQYAHPSGIVVLTPSGITSHYFLGIEYPPEPLHKSLIEASHQRLGSLSERLLLLCFHYDPKSGRYSQVITRIIQVSGVGSVLLLAAVILHASRKRSSASISALVAFALFPERASDIATSVDAIFYALSAVCAVVICCVVIAVLFSCIRYREGTHVKRTPRVRSLGLEIAWTSLTLLMFLGIFGWAAVVFVRMSQPPDDASEIHVVAKQWMWKVQHPSGRREINELHLLIGQSVKLVMTSQDVIHDFFVPAFRTKQDVLPGKYTTEWFTPTRAGRYHLFCAQYCGMDHSSMGGWVYVLQPNEHTQWLAEEQSSESMIAAGARLFVARGCSGCHSPNAAIRAPLLEGIYNKPVALSDGTTVIADDQYLHDSILLPNKQITAGYEAKMPTYQGQLSEDEVSELLAYVKSMSHDKGDHQ